MSEAATKITLVDHYAHAPKEIAQHLDDLFALLGENEDHVFRCTCEEGDVPRGSMEWDTNAYNHHRDCPSGWFYHYQVLLLGLARYFKEDAGSLVERRALDVAMEENDRWRGLTKAAQERERIATDTYNGQQQSYRELETLYQGAQERALKAEADAATLQQLIQRYLDDIQMSPLELNAGLRAHPGAALLAELDAARAVVAVARELWATDVDLLNAISAYDAAVNARPE
jgi:hypothetical protein